MGAISRSWSTSGSRLSRESLYMECAKHHTWPISRRAGTLGSTNRYFGQGALGAMSNRWAIDSSGKRLTTDSLYWSKSRRSGLVWVKALGAVSASSGSILTVRGSWTDVVRGSWTDVVGVSKLTKCGSYGGRTRHHSWPICWRAGRPGTRNQLIRAISRSWTGATSGSGLIVGSLYWGCTRHHSWTIRGGTQCKRLYSRGSLGAIGAMGGRWTIYT